MSADDAAAIRLLIVDDHAVVRIGLRTLLGGVSGIEVVGEAGSVATAVSEAIRLQPAVVLMDMRLPDGTGVDACREILAVLPQTHVLFLIAQSRFSRCALGPGPQGPLPAHELPGLGGLLRFAGGLGPAGVDVRLAPQVCGVLPQPSDSHGVRRGHARRRRCGHGDDA